MPASCMSAEPRGTLVSETHQIVKTCRGAFRARGLRPAVPDSSARPVGDAGPTLGCNEGIYTLQL